MSSTISNIESNLSRHRKIYIKNHREIHIASHRSHNPVAIVVKETKRGKISISITNDKNQFNQNNHDYNILAAAIEDMNYLLNEVLKSIFEGEITSKEKLNTYQVTEVTFDRRLFDLQTLIEKLDKLITIITDTCTNVLG
mgnify:CR=1 FL=1